nr:geranylgeranyl pyrophosphate synthase [Aspergillus striatus]
MGSTVSLPQSVSALWERLSFPFRVDYATKSPSSTPCNEINSPITKNEPTEVFGPPRICKKPIIRRPLDYLLSLPGKQLRTQLVLAFNEWFRVPDDKLQLIVDATELLHTASLLVDDIQDGSKLRRGHPAAHTVFGSAQTINSANFAYFLAQERLGELRSIDAFQIFITELLNLHRGQGLELYFRDCLICPTEEEYLEIVTHKTGGLFRLAVGLLQSQSEISLDCRALADTLGVIYQIRDDYLNLQSDQYAKSKGFGEDLTEGKFSFPIVHSILSAPENTTLIDILGQRTEDEAVKLSAIRHMESTGSFEYCRQRLNTLQTEAISMIEQIEDIQGPGHGIRRILRCLMLTS